MSRPLPKITVVTPSFNQGQFIEQTINSVLDQGYDNLEYIVIDGGSTDNSVDIIKKYERHLHYWVSEKDRGQSHAINKGLIRTTGEIFNWLNSDDFYASGTLCEVGELFQDPSVNSVCGKIRFLYPDGSAAISSPFPHSHDLKEVIASTKYLQPSTFFRTVFFNEVGGVDETLHYCMDYDLWIKYLMKYGLKYTRTSERVMVNFRFHNNSKSVAFRRSFYYDLARLFMKIEDESATKQYPAISREDLRLAIHSFYYDTLLSAYGLRDFKLFDLIKSRIDPSVLKSEDKDEFFRMKRRRNWIPSFMFR